MQMVVDMRWLRPLDRTTLHESLRRTRTLVVVHEAHTLGGVGAEILAGAAESGLDLHTSPVRVGTPELRIPAAPSLVDAAIPGVTEIIAAVLAQQATKEERESA